MNKTKVTKDLENKTLTIERVFDVPKEKVWNAYAEKNWFEKWWGPQGWETTVKEFNFTPGGRVHYGMKCVDKSQGEWFGQTSWGLMEVKRVDAPSSFSYTDYFSNEAGTINTELPVLTITNEFIEEDGKTKFVSTSYADSTEQIEQLVKMGMLEGFDSQMNKLDQLLGE